MAVIVHICTRFLRGGSEARIRDMVAALPEVSHVVIVGPESDTDRARAVLPTADLEVESRLRRQLSPANDLLCLSSLRTRIRRHRPTVVVTHQSKAGAIGRMAAWSAGVPAIVHSLSMASFGPGYGRVEDLAFRAVERILGAVTDGYLVVGEDLARRFAGLGIDEEKFTVIRSGVRLDGAERSSERLRAEIGEQWGVSPRDHWLVFVGSLEARKNVMLLPQVLERLSAVKGDLRPFLFVVGEGPQKELLQGRLESAGLAGVSAVAGYREDAFDFIRASDVLILPSSAEGLPQVVVQAAAAGTPFVASDVDGVREMLDLGAAGELVPLGNVDALAAAVNRALTQRAERTPLVSTDEWRPDHIRRAYRRYFGELLGIARQIAG